MYIQVSNVICLDSLQAAKLSLEDVYSSFMQPVYCLKSNKPVHDEPMRNIDFFQIICIMFRYAEQIQVITLFIIANLKRK